MKWKLIAAVWTVANVLVCAANTFGDDQLAVKNLRCEYKVDPLGIDVRKPRLSWELVSAERGVLQTSYEIRAAVSEADLAKGKVIWDSGKQSSEASIQVEYGGPALESRRVYYWQVRVADNHRHLSEWSKTAHWEMGLLEPADWKAKWITPNLVEDEKKSNPAPLLRKEFSVDKKVERARLYATAMGLVWGMNISPRGGRPTISATSIRPTT
jgi:alpha-L-rhamnosidase